MLAALFKLIFSLLFVILGYGVAGAIFGIFTGMVACLVIVAIINFFATTPSKQDKIRSAKHLFSRLMFVRNRAIVALIVITVITLLSTADSIISRIVLTSTEAGQYAAVATIAKMILAATSPLMWLALPAAVHRNNKIILKYIGIAFAISLAATGVFMLAPVFFTNVIIGIDAKHYTSLLGPAALGMSLCAVAFITLAATVCLGYLKRCLIVTLVSMAAFFITLLLISPTQGLLIAALYGQMTASFCFIAGLMPKLIRSS